MLKKNDSTANCNRLSRSTNTKQLVLCAVLVGLASILGMIKLLHLPYGGSITLLSMLAGTLCGYYCGLAKGITAGLALGLMNFILGGYVLHPAQVVLDYFIAYGALGLSGITCNRKFGLISGYIIGVVARFICSFFSGFVFFGSYAPDGMNPALYSFVYNGIYMGTEMLITVAILCIPAIYGFFEKTKKNIIYKY